jgi:hypothetical protein
MSESKIFEWNENILLACPFEPGIVAISCSD